MNITTLWTQSTVWGNGRITETKDKLRVIVCTRLTCDKVHGNLAQQLQRMVEGEERECGRRHERRWGKLYQCEKFIIIKEITTINQIVLSICNFNNIKHSFNSMSHSCIGSSFMNSINVTNNLTNKHVNS